MRPPKNRLVTQQELNNLKKRFSFSLIEVVIGLLLLSMLLGFLFFNFRQIQQVQSRVSKTKEIVMKREIATLRLSQIFSNASSFYTESPEQLVLKYTNELDIDPSFCGELTSLLCTQNKEMVLWTWNQEGASRKEVLYQGTSRLGFLFFTKGDEKWSPTIKEKKSGDVIMLKVIESGVELPFWL